MQFKEDYTDFKSENYISIIWISITCYAFLFKNIEQI